MTLVAEIIGAALMVAATWYPAPGWTERPDPVASPRARRGGILRFSGAQPPKVMRVYELLST